MFEKGNLLIISAPSGSGKTSLADRVLKDLKRIHFSVSHTTRRPREGERDGKEYFFVTVPQFEQMIQRKEFLEYAHVYGNYYGTSRAFVEQQLEAGNDVLLDIDVQGALKVKQEMPAAILVFVFPPSFQVLSERLRRRGLDDEEVIRKRLRIAREEIVRFREYDYLIVNQDLNESVLELESIVLAARSRRSNRLKRAEEIERSFFQ